MKRSIRNDIFKYAADTFKTEPDFPFEEDFDTAVLRHGDSRKWYGIIINVSYVKLGIQKEGNTDILNLKCDPLISGGLIADGKAMPAYHMNKEKWISVLLDGSVKAEDIKPLIDISFALTDKKKR